MPLPSVSSLHFIGLQLHDILRQPKNCLLCTSSSPIAFRVLWRRAIGTGQRYISPMPRHWQIWPESRLRSECRVDSGAPDPVGITAPPRPDRPRDRTHSLPMRKLSTGSRIFMKRTAMWRKGWGTQSYWNLKRASASRACRQTPVSP